MSARVLIVVFAALTVVFGLVATPFSAMVAGLGLERAGIAYGGAEGTLWRGRLTDVYWRDTPLGAVDVQPSVVALLLGRLSLDVVLGGTAVQGRATLSRGLFAPLTVQDAAVSAELAALPVMAKLSGRVEASLTEVALGPRGCLRARGRLTTDALTHGILDAPWRGPVLSGDVGCEAGTLTMPLAGAEGSEKVRVLMKLRPDRSFDVRVELDTADPAVTQLLAALGFRRDGGALVLEQEGRWG